MTEPDPRRPIRQRGAGRHRNPHPLRPGVRAREHEGTRSKRTNTDSAPTHRRDPEEQPAGPSESHAPAYSSPSASGSASGHRPASPTGRRRREGSEGSLRKASLGTAASWLIPGMGLIPTRFRKLGIALTALAVLVFFAGAGFLLFGNPVSTLLGYVTKRWFLITAMVLIFLGALAWIAVIAGTNRVYNRREGLQGSAKVASLALAYVLILTIALPATHAVNSFWAGQSLVGSDSVFTSGPSKVGTGVDPWKDTERINVLLLGQDAGADRTGTRPDTIMVASIDTKSGRTALFSIPRNLQYVRFPKGSAPAKQFPDGFDYYGRQQNLINAVWTWAEDVRPDLFPGDPHPGRTATTMAVEETLGLTIDYYAMVNLQGFQDMVDAVGGVELEVERDIPIGGGNSPVEGYVKKGWQKLDGFHALWYARSRHGSSDFDRNCRQQRIVRTVTEEVNVGSIVLALPRLMNATEKNIETDIPRSRLDAFADLAMRVQKGGFKSYPINPSVTPSGNPDYPYLKEWTQASIADSMSTVEAESVRGGAEDSTPSAKPTTTQSSSQQPSAEGSATPSTDATTKPTETPSADVTHVSQDPEEASKAKDDDSGADAVVVNKDPLAACMPGNEDPIN